MPYAVVGGHRLRLDLYVPAQAPRPVPLVVYIHGGGWSGLDRTEGFANGLLRRGFALACVEYRLSQEAPFPAQIQDCKAAVRWLRAHAADYGYGADKIGAEGDSAGGHLVSLLGVTAGNPVLEGADEGNPGVSSRVQAVADYFGPSDFTVFDPKAAGGAVPKLLGGPIDQNMEKARLASPLFQVTADACPFVIVQGDQDAIVPPKQSTDFLRRPPEGGRALPARPRPRGGPRNQRSQGVRGGRGALRQIPALAHSDAPPSPLPGRRARDRGGPRPDPALRRPPPSRRWSTPPTRPGQKKVTLPPGTYRFARTQPHVRPLQFEKMRDFEIDAAGCTFVLTDRSGGTMMFLHCANVTLRGAAFLHDPVSFSQGRIDSIAPDRRSFEVTVSPGYPAEYDDPRYFPSDNRPLYFFDGKTRLWKDGIHDYGVKTATRLGPGRFPVLHDRRVPPPASPLAPGDLVAWRGIVSSDIDPRRLLRHADRGRLDREQRRFLHP